mgnify:CR=1 FL=1
MTFEALQKDMVAAMKARDKVRKDAISVLVSAAKKVAIDEGCRDNITEEQFDLRESASINYDKSKFDFVRPKNIIFIITIIMK